MSYYAPLHKAGYTIDIVPPSRDLSKYKLVIAPGLEVLTREEAANLAAYVKQGGHLVLGQRSAMKDADASRWPERQPGPLAALLGARVEQYEALNKPVTASGVWGDAKAELFAEQLTESPEVKVLMRWHAPNSYWDNQPAAVTRSFADRGSAGPHGAGSFTYVGAWLDEAATQREVAWMLKEAGLEPDDFPVPAGVDVYKRTGADHNVFIVENTALTPQTVKLPSAMKNVFTGQTTATITLPVYGVAVFTQPK
jgi:beta-galactosidase